MTGDRRPAGRPPDALGDPSPPVVVAIDGRSGAGKTELARVLQDHVVSLGRTCTTVSLDALYPGWSGLAAALPVLCHDVLEPLRDGRPGAFASWDWHRSAPGPVVDVPLTDVLLVEGVGAGAAPCRGLVDLVVWLEAPVALRKERALRRDGSTLAPHWEQWAEQEDALFARGGGAAAADVVVEVGRNRR